VIAGSITGTMITIDDEAWPARGGMEAVFQISALFSAYAFIVALPVGLLLWAILTPLMRRERLAGPGPHLVAGLAIGLTVHLLVDLGISERIDEMRDFIGGTLAGGAAGLMWWLAVQRHERRAVQNG
jgi:hypothetical protein